MIRGLVSRYPVLEVEVASCAVTQGHHRPRSSAELHRSSSRDSRRIRSAALLPWLLRRCDDESRRCFAYGVSPPFLNAYRLASAIRRRVVVLVVVVVFTQTR